MKKALVIVESPTKASTIGKFLGDGFIVKSSQGHIRDLPPRRLGIDIKEGFKPSYEIIKDKKKIVKELKKSISQATSVYIATDEDREGEAIGWHLIEATQSDIDKVKRISFGEITKEAIQEALQNPRKIDLNLVDAQQARRILDRLVGYSLSPLLWQKVSKGLSAGRVQSVAVMLIVEREKKISSFIPKEYWSITAQLKKEKNKAIFDAILISKAGKKYGKLDISNEKKSSSIVKDLTDATYKVVKVVKKTKSQNPYPPFTTSTLQQESSRKLGFSAKKTMMIAQQLYEGVNLGEGESTGL
ncbi:DNA topoisomerase, partial [bacterium]|nr:DNA topoisomerase [bacterium]